MQDEDEDEDDPEPRGPPLKKQQPAKGPANGEAPPAGPTNGQNGNKEKGKGKGKRSAEDVIEKHKVRGFLSLDTSAYIRRHAGCRWSQDPQLSR